MAIFQNLTGRDKLKLLGIALLFVAIGQVRIFLLENINYQLYFLYYNTEKSSMHDMLSSLGSISYDNLMLVKWSLTIAFTIVIFLSSLWALTLVFHNKTYNKILAVAYGVLVFASFLLYISNGLFGEPDGGYYAARFVMGIAQSPMPLLILLPFFTLAKQK